MKNVLIVIAASVISSLAAAYCSGPPDGPYETYYENGQLQAKSSYSNGVLDGPQESYYENGELRVKGHYDMGEKCGEWIEDGKTVTYDPCPDCYDE